MTLTRRRDESDPILEGGSRKKFAIDYIHVSSDSRYIEMDECYVDHCKKTNE